MFSIHFRSLGGDSTVQTNGHETFEKLVGRLGRAKSCMVIDQEGKSVPLKRTPVEIGAKSGAVFDVARIVQVFDPINKVGYKLRYGGEKTEVLPTVGLDSFLSRSAGNKRVFLCKKYQARQCRAQGKCNSIHADRKKIAELRGQHPASEQAMKSEKLMEVFSEADNERFAVPLDRVLETAGSTCLLKSTFLDDSQCSVSSGGSISSCGVLCPLHDQKIPNCTMGKLCDKIHIDSAYLRHTKSMWKMPCCANQDCAGNVNTSSKRQLMFPSLSGNRTWEYFQVVDSTVAGVHPQQALTPTKGLKELCDAETGDVLRIHQTNVCRPHQRKACKWGVDCNNVHICRVRVPAGSVRSQTKSPAVSPETAGVEALKTDRPNHGRGPRPNVDCPPLLDGFDDDLTTHEQSSTPPHNHNHHHHALPTSSTVPILNDHNPTSPIAQVPDLTPMLKRFRSCYKQNAPTKPEPHNNFLFLSVLY